MVAGGTPLLVIGATLSRTGTLSTTTALERLGYKVWHGHLLPHGPWRGLFRNVANAEKAHDSVEYELAMDRLVQQLRDENFTATVDMPISAIYTDLMIRYPKAKVLLTVKDEADIEKWAQSFCRNVMTLGPIFRMPPFSLIPKFNFGLKGWLFPIRLGVKHEDMHFHGISKRDAQDPAEIGASISVKTAMELYKRYTTTVRATVPRRKLVEYNVQEEWQPLCDKIGFHPSVENKTCPLDEPFPHVNQTGTGFLNVWFFVLYSIAYTWRVLVVVGPFLVMYLVVKVYRILLRLVRWILFRQAQRYGREHED